jgi:hypothetical protein
VEEEEEVALAVGGDVGGKLNCTTIKETWRWLAFGCREVVADNIRMIMDCILGLMRLIPGVRLVLQVNLKSRLILDDGCLDAQH